MPTLHASQERSRAFKAGFLVEMGGIMDYSKMKRAQLIEEIEALQQKIGELEQAQAERKRAEEALRQSEGRFRSLIENASDIIVVLNADGTAHYVSPSIEQILGYEPDETIGRNISEFIHPDDLPNWISAFAHRLQHAGAAETPIEIRVRHKDGSWYVLEGRGNNLLHEPAVAGIVINARDITERKRAEEELAYLASHDVLTGLPNRMLFNDRVTLALARAQRNQQKLAVILLDLDYLKDVNDTLGHSVGDKLLRAVGERLTSLLRKSDTVARMGGDEFMLLLPETAQAEDAAKIASKILEAIRGPFAFDGHEIHITTSIGIAMYPDDGEDTDTLMRAADIAMYRAKAKGRDNYQRYTPAMKVDEDKGLT
jgi:diguanylate cyclase (GGDEF)-like protein/PAS domain S-box-containing protein